MPTTIKNTEKIIDKERAIIGNSVRSYAEEIFFVKKTKEAKVVLDKVGLPKSKKDK